MNALPLSRMPRILPHARQSSTVVLALAAAGLLHAGAASADLNYNYVQLDYIIDGEASGGGSSLDYNGFRVETMMEVAPQFLATVSAAAAKIDVPGAEDSSLNFFSLGGGGYMPLLQGSGPRLDVYGTLTYEEIHFAGLPSSGGYGITAGLRWQPTPQMEINPSVGWVDYGSLDTGTGKIDLDGFRYGVRGLFHATANLAIALDIDFQPLDASVSGSSDDLDLDEIRLGVRWQF
ncbi:MAG: hypothetical protein LAT61_08870 [Alcanivorax sp.]|nr:hypothetical protein [Alcanivorax sp.]